MAGFFQTRERRALVVFLLLAGVFVAGLLLADCLLYTSDAADE